MAEGTHSTTLNAHKENNRRQLKTMQQQLDDQQQTIHVVTDGLDQMIDIIRTLIENHHVISPREEMQESIIVVQDDQNF